MNALTPIKPHDPAQLGWPPMLPYELAMKSGTVEEILDAYGISEDDWLALRETPIFLAACAQAREELKKEGMGFKVKARIQAEALLEQSWDMIHAPDDEVPPNVKADLIKFTIRAAGLDGSKDQGQQSVGTALQINISL